VEMLRDIEISPWVSRGLPAAKSQFSLLLEP
jgi:hypothetical protein